MNGSEQAVRNGIAAEAAQWFAAMQDTSVSARERGKFSEWLSQSSRHVEEYLAVAAVWRHLDATADARRGAEELIQAAREDRGSTNIVDLSDTFTPALSASFGGGATAGMQRVEQHMERLPRVKVRWVPAIAATFSILAVGISAWFFADFFNGHRYSTAIGEQTSFTLDDGSVVRLNTQSSVRVRLNGAQRTVTLLAGEAMFEVAKDLARPFRVITGDAVVEVLGTTFNVRRTSGETKVTVLEGRVRVSSNASPKLTELRPNEGASVRAAGQVIKESKVDLEQTTAWIERRLVFYTETLQTVVEEFNRYNTQRLEVTDPDLAAIHISGNFRATDPQSLVQFLEHTESVKTVRASNTVTRLSRSGER